jgi:hypothetical protein
MPWEIKAVYGLILDLIFDAQGKLGDDAARIINYLGVGMSLQRWSRIRQDLLDRGKLRLVDGFLTNDKMTRDLASENSGSTKGGTTPPTTPPQTGKIIDPKTEEKITDLFDATANNINGQGHPETPQGSPVPARARESKTQRERETDDKAVVILAVQEIAKALNQDRGRYWENDYRRMREEGLEYGDILEAARAHRGGHVKGLTWLSGLARAKRDARLAGKRTSTPAPEVQQAIDPTTLTHRQWEEHLALLLRIGSWDAAKLGPPPTRAGHHVPAVPYGRWHKLWIIQGEHPMEEADSGGNIVPFPSDRPSAFMRGMWQRGEGESAP